MKQAAADAAVLGALADWFSHGEDRTILVASSYNAAAVPAAAAGRLQLFASHAIESLRCPAALQRPKPEDAAAGACRVVALNFWLNYEKPSKQEL